MVPKIKNSNILMLFWNGSFQNHLYYKTKPILQYYYQDMDQQKRTFKVQTLSNQIYPLEVAVDTKVTDVKTLITERTSIPTERQRLVFNQRVLNDDQPISTYLKNNDSTIFLMSKIDTDGESRAFVEDQIRGKEGRITYNSGQTLNQGFNQGFNPNPYNGQAFDQNQNRNTQTFYSGGFNAPPPPGMIPTFKIPTNNTLVPFQQSEFSLNQLTAFSQIINELGHLPSPPIPVFVENSHVKKLGQYLAQWHYEMQRLMPHVYKLSQLLQKQDYLNQIGRLQTQQQIFNVSTALQASVNATVPLIMESNRTGSSFSNFNPHFNFQRPNAHNIPRTFSSPPSQNRAGDPSDGSFDFRQYPFGFTNPYNPIPMGEASPYWDGKPPKMALQIAYGGDVDQSSLSLKRLIGNWNNLSSIWLQLFGEATVSDLFFVCSGDETGFIQKIRPVIANKIDETTSTKITRSLTNLLVSEGLKSQDIEGLNSYLYERISPHVELILNLTKQVKVDYTQSILKQIRSALGQILYELVQATSGNIEGTLNTILGNLKRNFLDFFPNTDAYFALLSPKLKKTMTGAYSDYQKKVQDERNRLII